jgi:hypothetical protein
MSRCLRRFIARIVPILLLTACSNTLPLHYTGQAHPVAATATISAINVVDQRGETDPTWYGAIRGGYGNPLKILHADKPVRDTVRDAFETALATRGVRIDPGTRAPALSVTVIDFQADRVMRSSMRVRMVVSLADPVTSGTIYRQEILEDPTNFTGLDLGVFGSPSELQQLAETTMSRAIDEAVDAPGFQAAMRSQQSGPRQR